MSRTGNIITAILMWCAIVAYVVAATRHAGERRTAIDVTALRIAITDTTRVVTAEKVQRWMRQASIDPIGRPIDSADTRTIERALASRPEVKHVSAWTDLDGTLTVRIAPRTPAMRVRTAGGYRFWLTDDGVIIPDRGDFAAYVPVVTGAIPFPFAPSAEGSYAQMQAENYNDFLERFTALETERRSLSARLASTRADIRATRASTPKRWWGRSRKDAFRQSKTARTAELEKQRDETILDLAKLDKLEAALREKEKKSYQSYRFLYKLANFVEFIGRDRFWSAQIVQIHAVGDHEVREGTGSGVGTAPGAEEWHEPQLELTPRAGNHTILLGELDGTERQRLENLRLFYAEGLWHEGWNGFGYINIKYGNQIVCTK